ncbi:MAG: SDR family oxidoreductase, partial [Dehalococcoidia bacterium]|nr:SDR family oxidoreductase [Dehalococcoidia bacterium]
MPGKLSGQVAVITGGNSGIGEATAHLFASEGAKIALLARRVDEGTSVQDAINANGGEAKFFSCDVSKSEECVQTIEKVIQEFGRIDILFNNAGSGDGGNFPNETNEGWERVLSVNLSSVFYMSKAVWPHLISAGGGKIVNNSSLA